MKDKVGVKDFQEILMSINNLDEQKPETDNFYLYGSEWNRLCESKNISNKYFLRKNNYYCGCISLDVRGFLKLEII